MAVLGFVHALETAINRHGQISSNGKSLQLRLYRDCNEVIGDDNTLYSDEFGVGSKTQKQITPAKNGNRKRIPSASILGNMDFSGWVFVIQYLFFIGVNIIDKTVDNIEPRFRPSTYTQGAKLVAFVIGASDRHLVIQVTLCRKKMVLLE
ncbi:hypothetical protein DFH07DRAFT_765576 [Mycena maculata]|uniref:Uncharacterized protein n=1 Tax=Mycena maculata TaxID=230809 RepID=A0AAD7K866_9AGAR|nr:hypothetical protein DFH07DRAFT_765576 [Mycena maculata]